MRHCPAFRLLVLGLLVLSVSLSAQPNPSYPNYTAHVNDFANVVDPNTETQIETILTNFEKLTGTQIAVVTMTTIGERPLEDYANGLYRAWGIGAKSGANRDKGALLLVLTQDRRSRLEVGYGLEGDLPDGLAGEQLRRMRPFFQQQQWSQGLLVGTRTLVDTLAEKWNVNVEGIDRSFAYQPAAQVGSPQLQISTRTLIFLGIGFLILLFIMSRLVKRASHADQLRRR
ncbi:MAG TPA: TPM domain-containing protein, partial [Blastocatellia bacterium]|nr:TPM domain-containing protein [Blastocatellia bacterium]